MQHCRVRVQIFDNNHKLVFWVANKTSPVYLHLNPSQDQSWQFHMFHSCLLNYLGLVDLGGMGTDQIGVGFGPECAISLLIAPRTVSLGPLRAVGLAVLVIRVLLTGWTSQTFIHFILIICHWWIVAAHGRGLVIPGDTSGPRTPV